MTADPTGHNPVLLAKIGLRRCADLTRPEQNEMVRVLTAFPGTEIGTFQPSGTEPRLKVAPVLAEADAELAEAFSTWRSVDLREHLHPDAERDAPGLLLRTDGVGSFYESKRNEIHGPYESGKSWVALVAALEVIRGGGVVVWIDFEDAPGSIARRLMYLGADEEAIVSRVRYIGPAEALTDSTELDLRLELNGATLVVIDAANEAMAAAGLDPNHNKDVAAFYATIPRLTIDAGATVLMIDHVAKDPAGQRGAVGAGHKIAAIDGASYRVDATTPFGRGSVGSVQLRLAKDRPGFVRGALGPGREPVAAEITFDATDPEAIAVLVNPPPGKGPDEEWQPTHLMEKVSRFIETCDGPLSLRAICDAVQGKSTYVRTAVGTLVEGGFVSRASGPRGALLHTSVKPFREEDAE